MVWEIVNYSGKFQPRMLTTNDSKPPCVENMTMRDHSSTLPFFSITRDLRPLAQHEALQMDGVV